jgi:hypothetical protein
MGRRNGAVLILAGLLAACAAVPGGTSAPKITTGPLSWKINQTEYSFTATGSAPVQISDTAHAYLLLYRVHWARKLDAADSAETASTVALIVPGVKNGRSVEIVNTETRCTQYSSPKCLRTAQDPEARIELVGWTRFEHP